jgi:hypothetical protein
LPVFEAPYWLDDRLQVSLLKVGMHRILILPDIRLAGYPANPKAGYSAGYPANPKAGYSAGYPVRAGYPAGYLT